MRFSIVTPSFRSSEWLKLCIASVADQDVDHEHIVQDSCSDDGTQEWLPQDKRVAAYVERDKGMYDAINRGMGRAKGEILAYLNCDEQYLPGALRSVENFFEAHPDVDVVFGYIVIVDGEGDYLWHRKVLLPTLYHLWISHLTTLSCAMFFRRRVIEKHGVFDPVLRDVGDGEWVLRLLKNKVPMAVLPQFTSSFTFTGTNMCVGPNARREKKAMIDSAPRWAQRMAPLLVAQHRLRRLFGGIYFQAPFDYAIYTRSQPASRQTFHVARPTSRWGAAPA
jgi:glycosyltransferase involved in cell wall biosynthesis